MFEMSAFQLLVTFPYSWGWHPISSWPWRVIVQPMMEGYKLDPEAKRLSRLSAGRGKSASSQQNV